MNFVRIPETIASEKAVLGILENCSKEIFRPEISWTEWTVLQNSLLILQRLIKSTKPISFIRLILSPDKFCSFASIYKFTREWNETKSPRVRSEIEKVKFTKTIVDSRIFIFQFIAFVSVNENYSFTMFIAKLGREIIARPKTRRSPCFPLCPRRRFLILGKRKMTGRDGDGIKNRMCIRSPTFEITIDPLPQTLIR